MAPQKQSSGSSPAVSEVSQDSGGPYGSELAQKWGIGELVLAKLQGFPPWPARISEPEESHGLWSTSKTYIYLFGLGERRFCNSTEISSFSANAKAEFQKLQSEDFPSIYVQAVREICSADDELKLAAENGGKSQGQGLVKSAVDVKEQDSILDLSSPHAIGNDIIVDSSQTEKLEHVESVQAVDVGDVVDRLPDEVNCRVATSPKVSMLTFQRNTKTHSEKESNLCSPCSLPENAQDRNENGDIASLGVIREKGQSIVDEKLEIQKQVAQSETVMEILASNTSGEFTEGHIATTKLEEDLVKEPSCLASSTTNVQPVKDMSLSGHSEISNMVQEMPTTKLESKEDSSPCTTHGSMKRKEAPRLVYSRRKPKKPQQDLDMPRLEDINAIPNTEKLEEHNLANKSKMLISDGPSTSKAIEQGADNVKHKVTAPKKVKKRLMKHGRVVDSENNSNLSDAVKSKKEALEDSLHDNGTADMESGEAALPPSKRRKRVLEAMTACAEEASKFKVVGSPEAGPSSVHGQVEVRMLEKRSRKRKPSTVGDEKLENVHEHSTEDGEEKPASRHPHEAGTLQKGGSPNNAAQHKHHKKAETKITLKIKQNVKIGSNDIVNSHAAHAMISPCPDGLEMNGELKGNSAAKNAMDGKEEIKSLIAKAQEVRRLRLTTAPLISNVDAQKSSPLAQGSKEALPLVSPVLHPKSADRSFASQIQPPELSIGIHPPAETVEVNNGVHNVSINTHSIVVDEMEAGVSLQALEGMLETLSRTKDSINRATRLAMECARYGVADQVVMKIMEKIESESSFHKKVDLFFLVDSITQCSNAKGVASTYPRAVEAVLPQLLRATAPFRTAARENRRQCLKVLKLWLERNILPASVLRRHIDELDAQPGCTFDDTLQGMEGINEYGSNAGLGLNLQDICPDEDLQQVPSHINMENCGQQAVFGEYLLSPQALTSSNDTFERQKCLLEDGGVDMEMVDVYHASNAGSTKRVDPDSLETPMEASIPLPLSPPPSPPPLPASPPPSPPPPPSQPPPPPPPPPFYNQASNFATGRPPASAQYPVDMRYKRNQMEGSHYKWGSQEYHGRPAAGPQHFDKHMPRVNGADTPNSFPPASSHFHRRPMPFGPQYQSSGGSRMLSHPQSNNPVKHWQRHDNRRYIRRQHM